MKTLTIILLLILLVLFIAKQIVEIILSNKFYRAMNKELEQMVERHNEIIDGISEEITNSLLGEENE